MFKRIIVIGVVLFMCLGLFVGCGSSQGIPHGAYHSCNEEGVVTRGAPEGAWQVKDEIAERLYLKYTITESEGKVYFECEASGSDVALKFEVKYDSKTKILTVYMPSSIDGETKAFYFKK